MINSQCRYLESRKFTAESSCGSVSFRQKKCTICAEHNFPGYTYRQKFKIVGLLDIFGLSHLVLIALNSFVLTMPMKSFSKHLHRISSRLSLWNINLKDFFSQTSSTMMAQMFWILWRKYWTHLCWNRRVHRHYRCLLGNNIVGSTPDRESDDNCCYNDSKKLHVEKWNSDKWAAPCSLSTADLH